MQRRAASKKFRNIQTRDLQFRHQFNHTWENVGIWPLLQPPGKMPALKGNILNSVASGAT